MTPFARVILTSPASRAATYQPPGGGAAVACRVLLNDTPGETRREAGEEYFSDDAELATSPDFGIQAQGVFTVGDSQYHVVAIQPSRAPGLIDCAVYRIAGPGVELFDLSGPVLGAGTVETIFIDGRAIRATVARNASTLLSDEDGVEMIVSKNRIGVSLADAAGVSAGSIVMLDGRNYVVHSAPRRTAAGLATIIC